MRWKPDLLKNQHNSGAMALFLYKSITTLEAGQELPKTRASLAESEQQKAEISYQQQALSSVWLPGMAHCWATMTDPSSGQTFPIPAAPKAPATMKSHCCLPLL